MAKLNDNKIAIVVKKNKREFDCFCDNVIKKLLLPHLDGEAFFIQVMRDAGDNRAAFFNRAMQLSDAKYKVYIGENVVDLVPDFLLLAVNTFLRNKRLGMLGFLGSGMPISGKATDARRRWGRYFQQGKQGVSYETPLFYQEVSLIDSQVMVTSVDVPWDEECGDEYLGAAACLARRRQNISVAVPMTPGMAFVSSVASEYEKTDWDEAKYRKFFKRYEKDLQPLVSVLIPAYNEPNYCREALESVLSQDYKNLEILIGDDSTDDRVGKVLKPYLKKYPYIKYDRHDKPYGGIDNLKDLLARCKGEYVNVLFHDDVFLPKKISSMMSHMVEDVDEEIAFVTSVRPRLIDGELVYDSASLMFDREYMVYGENLARKILNTCINVVGEMTTVLFRKHFIYMEGDKFTYRIGYFCGYEEKSMGDVSTWLAMLSQKKCVFMKDPLSAFRLTPEQNTWKPGIIIQAALDWLNMIVAARLHNTFLHTKKDFKSACWGWHDSIGVYITSQAEKFTGELSEKYQTFLREIEAVEHGKFDVVMKLAVDDMVKNGAKREDLLPYYGNIFVRG